METRLAKITSCPDDIVLVQVKEDVRIDPSGIQEIMDTLTHSVVPRTVAVIVTIPEDTDFAPAVMCTDHCAKVVSNMRIRTLAFVTASPMFQSLSELYFRYYPHEFEVRAFALLEDGIAWAAATPEERIAS